MQNPNIIPFTTEYTAILDKINGIDPVKYEKTRNFLNGHVSYLSPYISRGVISVKQIVTTLLKNGFTIQSSEKFIQELAWREYYQRVWQSKKDLIWHDLKHTQQDVSHYDMIASIKNATTGIHVIDNAIYELYNYGYLHNHMRMYIAAITCNVAKVYWLEPSKWMYYYLLDGDIASNNCNWQWVAGAFSNKKYYCNQENINKYTGSNQMNTFLDHSYEQIINISVPDSLKELQKLNLITILPKTKLPQIDISIPTLIYNSYNLDPLWRKDMNANRVLLLEPSHFNKFPVSEKVIQFIIQLSKNIKGIQIYVGEIDDIKNLYGYKNSNQAKNIIYKEHPMFQHYSCIIDERDWIFPSVSGYYTSFFSYWKKCQKQLSKYL